MIRVAIMGYGNIGRGVEAAIAQAPDMELGAIFTRRPPDSLSPRTANVAVLHVDDAREHINDVDVMILCGGSATDLPEQGPHFATMFNSVDSFDTHAKIPAYYASVDEAARAHGKTSIISVGWDPGFFSMIRLFSGAILPQGKDYTFWGPGLSQGHSDAIRRIKGVKDAVQYTIPVPSAVDRVRSGKMPEFTPREKHTRNCYIVAEEGADTERIAEQVRSMPNYFADYDTTVTFISQEELKRDHSGMGHGGFIIRSGETGMDTKHRHLVELSLKLESNAEFTASIMVAYARAAYRLNRMGQVGAKTVFDVPLSLLSHRTPEDLRASLL